MMRRLPVMRFHDLLAQLGDLGHGLSGKIERGLLIGHKGRVETVLALVPAIGGDHGKTARQSRAADAAVPIFYCYPSNRGK